MRPPRTTIPVVAALTIALLAGCSSSGGSSAPTTAGSHGDANPAPSSGPASSGAGTPSPSASAAYSVSYDPADFSATVDNPWFPLAPGTTLTYMGIRDGEPARDVVTVTNETVKIDGVPCRVVHDRLYLSGRLAESTSDYYSQDSQGNVWYFGEDTAEFDEDLNVVSTEGTWHTAEAGALPGIFMPANPAVGDTHRQEYYPAHAEDFFKIVDLSASITVPYGSFTEAMRTEEWTPLEPDVLDNKYYVKGIGEVKEVAVKGGQEELALTKASTA
jgi:hypothetical protein